MKKLTIISVLAVVLVFVVIGFYAFNQFIYNQKQGTGDPTNPYEATLTGEYVCLPHKDTSGPTTLECAFGIKTPTGEYYALDLGEGDPTRFVSGETVTLKGTITPIENLSSDRWQVYDIEGIFSVKTNETPIDDKSDLITVQTPLSDARIVSPLEVRGAARGTWFFEATFPVVLVDWDGKIIAQGYAEAQDNWMTEEFVAYKATLQFENPSRGADFSKRGALILQKSNPSGLPQNDDALELPVRFE